MNRAWIVSLGCLALIGSSALATDVEATVNGQTIQKLDVDAAFARTSVSRQPLPEQQRQMYRAHVLNVLIDNLLLKQFLDSQGIKADSDAVDEHIEQFQAALTEKGSTLDSFLADTQTTVDRMRKEVEELYQWFAHVEAQATEKNLQAYFDANKSAFDGSQVRASHILVEVLPTATQAERLAAYNKIQQVKAQLAAGTDFASLAKQHSDCQSKEQGGDVGYFTRKGKMTEPFAQAAFALPKGRVSDIVETEYGYHLLMVSDVKPGTAVRYEAVADDVRALFAGDLRAAIITAMRKKADIVIPRPTMTAAQPGVNPTR
jgi:parvulin-like peptidyl-prolyl isomerase